MELRALLSTLRLWQRARRRLSDDKKQRADFPVADYAEKRKEYSTTRRKRPLNGNGEERARTGKQNHPWYADLPSQWCVSTIERAFLTADQLVVNNR